MSEATTIKKPRQMSPKGFLAKLIKPNLSAKGFIDQYHDYMMNGEMSYVLAPIVSQVDAGKMLPTPAIAALSNAVMYHQIAADELKMQQRIEKQQNPGSSNSAHQKNWTATIYDDKDVIQVRVKENGEEEELVRGFSLSGDADNWVDRRLAIDGKADWYAVIQHNHSNVRVVIMRDDANARFNRASKRPAMKAQSKSTGKLSFGVNSKESRAFFSRG